MALTTCDAGVTENIVIWVGVVMVMVMPVMRYYIWREL